MKNEDRIYPKVGLAWWRREQWDRLLEISEDRDGFQDTYDEWLADTEQHLDSIGQYEKLDLDVEQLLAWCNEQGLPVNGSSRARYVAEVLRARDS